MLAFFVGQKVVVQPRSWPPPKLLHERFCQVPVKAHASVSLPRSGLCDWGKKLTTPLESQRLQRLRKRCTASLRKERHTGHTGLLAFAAKADVARDIAASAFNAEVERNSHDVDDVFATRAASAGGVLLRGTVQ